MIIAACGFFITFAGFIAFADAERFVQTVTLHSGLVVVVAEGDLEPRSIGTYCVRLYSSDDPQFPTDRFLSGAIYERDGTIEKIMLADIDGDSYQEVVVVVRCAGSGSYLSAQAFSIRGTNLTLLAAVAGLLPNTDPLSALKHGGL